MASPLCVAVGIGSKTEHAQRLAVGFTERPSILAVGLDRPEPGADGVERIDEIGPSGRRRAVGGKGAGLSRSEEHTSELQSLMSISYAVFCLKKKNIHKE